MQIKLIHLLDESIYFPKEYIRHMKTKRILKTIIGTPSGWKVQKGIIVTIDHNYVPLSRGQKWEFLADHLCDQNCYWMEYAFSSVSQVEKNLINHLFAFFVMVFSPHFEFLNNIQELHMGCYFDSNSRDVVGGSRIGTPFLDYRIIAWRHHSCTHDHCSNAAQVDILSSHGPCSRQTVTCVPCALRTCLFWTSEVLRIKHIFCQPTPRCLTWHWRGRIPQVSVPGSVLIPVMMVWVMTMGRELVIIPIVIAIMPGTVRLMVEVITSAHILVTVHLTLVSRPSKRGFLMRRRRHWLRPV